MGEKKIRASREVSYIIDLSLSLVIFNIISHVFYFFFFTWSVSIIGTRTHT